MSQREAKLSAGGGPWSLAVGEGGCTGRVGNEAFYIYVKPLGKLNQRWQRAAGNESGKKPCREAVST